MALVERLKLGLGACLDGLSEDARVTALDWTGSIEGSRDSAMFRSHVPLARAAGG